MEKSWSLLYDSWHLGFVLGSFGIGRKQDGEVYIYKASHPTSMKAIILNVLLLIVFTLGLSAQQVIKGRVVDRNSYGLWGATIIIEGTKTGTVADSPGRFTLTAPEDTATLDFRFIGYASKRMRYENGMPIGNKTSSEIKLKEDVIRCFLDYREALVDVGYGLLLNSPRLGLRFSPIVFKEATIFVGGDWQWYKTDHSLIQYDLTVAHPINKNYGYWNFHLNHISVSYAEEYDISNINLSADLTISNLFCANWATFEFGLGRARHNFALVDAEPLRKLNAFWYGSSHR